MHQILKTIDAVSFWSGRAVSFLLIPLTIVMCYSIVSRRFFSTTLDWGFEVSIFLYGIFIMIAGAEVLRVKGHIIVDVIPNLLSPRKQIVLKILSSIIIIIVSYFILTQGYRLALESTQIQEHSAHQTVFNPQIWWFKWFIPISGLLLLFQAIRQLISEVYELQGKEEQHDT